MKRGLLAAVAAASLFSSCTLQETDPTGPGGGGGDNPPPSSGYSGTISKDSTWQGVGTVFRIVGDLTITGNGTDMVWGRKIEVVLDDDVQILCPGRSKACN